MACDANSNDNSAPKQIALSPLFKGLARAKRRISEIEASLAGPGSETPTFAAGTGPLPKTIAGLQRVVNDHNPRVAHLRHGLINEIATQTARDVDAISKRLDQAVKHALNAAAAPSARFLGSVMTDAPAPQSRSAESRRPRRAGWPTSSWL